MLNRLLLPIARRVRPELAAMSGLEMIGSLIDIAVLIYMLPFAVAGLVWLIAVTDLGTVRQESVLLIIVLLASWIFIRLDFTLRLEVRPGVFAISGGSLETLALWSAVLIMGPSALWLAVATAALKYEWQRRAGGSVRWERWSVLVSGVATRTLAGLLAMLVYEGLGGRFPFPGLISESLLPVILATITWLVALRLLALPVLLYAGRSPELVGPESLADQATLTRFLLIGESIPGLADPFAVLAASLFASEGAIAYGTFIVGAVLAALLANRLSQAIRRSEQRTRELAMLEQLSRAIMASPAEKSSLPDVLAEHVRTMFPHCRMQIVLFPDEILLKRQAEGIEVDERVWQRLRLASEGYTIFEDAPYSDRMQNKWDGLAVAINLAEEGTIIGGIYLLCPHGDRRQRSVGRVLDFLPALQTLAAQIASAIDRIELYERALAEQAEVYQQEVYAQAFQAEVYAQALALEKMTKELAAAGQIQASFLPEEPPDIVGWQLSATLEPAREASGDFYDFVMLPEGRLGLIVADVADKGMGAALYMALSRTLIRTFAIEYYTAPEQALSVANARILADTNSDLFVTVFYAILDTRTGDLMYCNAGHNPPMLLHRKNGNVTKLLTRTALPLGIFSDSEWNRDTEQLMPGDVLMLYTDGVTEAENEDSQFFGQDRLRAILESNPGRSAAIIENKIIAAVDSFKGDAEQSDDMTLMVVVRET